MKISKTFCDFCGQEIKDNMISFHINFPQKIIKNYYTDSNSMNIYEQKVNIEMIESDICEACAERIADLRIKEIKYN